MKKLFACDLDGTLLNINHDTDEIINEGIKKVIDSGSYISIASGRNRCQVMMVDFPEGVFYVCLNGALILNEKHEPIYKNVINAQYIQEMLETVDAPVEYVTDQHTYVVCGIEEYFEKIHIDEVVKAHNGKEGFIDQIIADIHFNTPKEFIEKQDVCKCNLHIGDTIRNKELDQLLKKYEDQLVNSATNDHIYEITSKSVNKGESVHILAQHLGIADDHVFVYGDAGNDVEMLERFENAFVPENGLDIAKACAKEIIGSNIDHSVINHILKNIT